MAQKKIVWSPRAKLELSEILEYFVKRNGSSTYSLKLLGEIEKLTLELGANAFLGRLTTDRKSRVIPLKEYLVFYQVNRQVIEILAFWDNRQNQNDLKL